MNYPQSKAIVGLMKPTFSKLLAVLFIAPILLLGACAQEHPASTLPEIGFSHLEKIHLKASTIEVTSQYQSSLKAPNVEHRFSTSPEKAAINWANSRLAVSGNAAYKARFVIIDASVIEVPVEKTKSGIVGVFTAEPTANYFASLKAKLIMQPINGGTASEISINANRNILIHENVSLAERESIWLEMVEALMFDFNNEMESRIRTHFSNFVE